MTWIRIDDAFADHPKAIGLSDAAIAAWLRGLCYAGRYETDGRIPANSVRAITRKKAAVEELVGVGLWHANGDGYHIHDYLSYNPSKAELDAERDRSRLRQKRHRERHRNGVTDA